MIRKMSLPQKDKKSPNFRNLKDPKLYQLRQSHDIQESLLNREKILKSKNEIREILEKS